MMEEKKLLLEKEMHERKNRMEERNEIFGKQRRRRESKHLYLPNAMEFFSSSLHAGEVSSLVGS